MVYPVYGGGGLTGRYHSYLFKDSKIAIGRVGARCGCIFITDPKSWITDNALYLKEISSNLDQNYLVLFLKYLNLRKFAKQAAQPVISQTTIKNQNISIPPLSEQKRIVEYLDRLQSKIEIMKKEREKALEETNALLPSILDKAFKGEL